MTVSELRKRINSSEFSQWQVFFGVEPRGDERQDYNFSQLLTVYANSHTKKGARKYKLNDFLLDFTPPKQSYKSSRELYDKLKLQVAYIKSGGSNGTS